MQRSENKKHHVPDSVPSASRRRVSMAGRILMGVTLIAVGAPAAYAVYAESSPVIRANILIDGTPVSGLTPEAAYEKISKLRARSGNSDITLRIDGSSHPILATDIELRYDIEGAVARAWNFGKNGTAAQRMFTLATAPFLRRDIPLEYGFNRDQLRDEIGAIALMIDKPIKDIRLSIQSDGSVEILTDTSAGAVLDREQAMHEVERAISERRSSTRALQTVSVSPTVRMEEAERSREQVLTMLNAPIQLAAPRSKFTIDRDQLAEWIVTESQSESILVSVDEPAVSAYITTIARALNAEPQSPSIKLIDGKVVDFVVPRSGQRLDQSAAIAAIMEVLTERQLGNDLSSVVQLAVHTEEPKVIDQSALELGITELIGGAATRFTGSPANRIANIKNGAKFLSGILVHPGEEFSTLQALGTIDNTTGYLPELVIKENRTIPEYGGGLCQVSTTLFRAALNSGLPITARRNHSYRVSYYEKDGDGEYIGPGLDATIYNPAPDFKFKNDTGASILIQGFVEGDKVTFNMYGTRDGRVATVDGPRKLSETPAGAAIYVETDTLKPGEKKQLERSHNGGSAIAIYTVRYADGTETKQEFKSVYRNWPARYLVGATPAADSAPGAVSDSASDTAQEQTQ